MSLSGVFLDLGNSSFLLGAGLACIGLGISGVHDALAAPGEGALAFDKIVRSEGAHGKYRIRAHAGAGRETACLLIRG
jgi:hypothetical protein